MIDAIISSTIIIITLLPLAVRRCYADHVLLQHLETVSFLVQKVNPCVSYEDFRTDNILDYHNPLRDV